LQQQEPSPPIIFQQPTLPAGCQPQPITIQKSGISRPITVQQPSLSQPVTSQQQEPLNKSSVHSQPISMQQPELGQPITTWQPTVSCPMILQRPQSQHVPCNPHEMSWPINAPQSQLPPITAQQPGLPQPINMQPAELPRPITTQQQPQLPWGYQQPSLSRPITTQQQSQPITMPQPQLSRPVTIQQPTLSQPMTLQQEESTNFISVSSVKTLSVSCADFIPSDHQPHGASTQLYSSLNQPASIPTGSFLPANAPPMPHPVPFTDTSPIPPPAFIQRFMSQPPPPLSAALQLSGSTLPVPVRSMMSSSSLPFVPRPTESASATSPPGILCRPSSWSPVHEMKRFVPGQESDMKYFQAVSGGPRQMEDGVPRYGQAGGDGPPRFMHPYGPYVPREFAAIGRYAASVSPDNQVQKSASSGTLGYDQGEFGNTENWDHNASGTDGSGAEMYSQAAYSDQCHVQYLPASGGFLNTSPNTWPPGRVMPEFQPTAEVPTAEPVSAWSPSGGYVYMPPNPGLETPPIMYHMMSGGRPSWDYTHGFSMTNSTEIPRSVVPPSMYPRPTLQQGDTVGQGLHLSDDQSAVSAASVTNVNQQSYADVARSAPMFHQNDRDTMYPTAAERYDNLPQSCERGDAVQHVTVAGTFCRGKSVSVLVIRKLESS